MPNTHESIGVRAGRRPRARARVPGIQGRWEYIAPTVDALAGALSRADVFAGRAFADAHATSSSSEVDRLVAACSTTRGIDRAIVCGISFGGLVATPFRRDASGANRRARPGVGAGARLASAAASPVLRALAVALWSAVPRRKRRSGCEPSSRPRCPIGPTAGVRALAAADDPDGAGVAAADGRARARAADCRTSSPTARASTAPTLVVTGERPLDRVVPVDGTAAYAGLIRGARRVVARAHRSSGHDHAAGGVRRRGHAFVAGGAESPARGPDSAALSGPQTRCRLMRLREIAGPAGRSRRCSTSRRRRRRERAGARRTRPGRRPARRGRPRASASAVRRHDAHQGRVPGGEGVRPHRLRRAALQLPRRRHERRQRSTTAPARWTTSAPALDFMRERYPGVPLWAAGMSFGAWIALDGRRRTIRASRRSSASRRRCRSYDFEPVTHRARSRSSSSRASATSCAR